MAPSRMPEAIVEALDLDRSACSFSADGAELMLKHAWSRPESRPSREGSHRAFRGR